MVEDRSNIMSNKMTGIKNLYIDLDDTLWDFTANSKIALRYVYDKFNLNRWGVDYDQFKKIYIEKNKELWDLYHLGKIKKDYLVTERFRFTFAQIGVEIEYIEELSQIANDEYLDYLAMQSTIVPGAIELLEYLTKKFEVRILSNGFKGVQAKKLISGGLEKYIHSMILSDDIGITKPLPGIFEYAVKCVSGTPESTLMIGDNYEADVCGAHNAGWKTIFFNRRGTKVDNNVADAVVTSLTDIIGLI